MLSMNNDSSQKIFYRGKVRDLYDVEDAEKMLIYTSDRVSVFDVVFQESIPKKGIILNQISTAWMRAIERAGLTQKHNFSTHIISEFQKDFPPPFNQNPYFKERCVYVRQGARINFECIVRGYLLGSAWKEYKEKSSVGEIKLPKGLHMGAKLEKPIFTPSTKAELGQHDENVSFTFMKNTLGEEFSETLKAISLALYEFANKRLENCSLVLADTKFEFAMGSGKEIILIDEILTPDSSRYWRKDDYEKAELGSSTSKMPGGLDKQHIRDYVEELGWDKKPPPPPLPKEIIDKTVALYEEVREKILSVL